MIAIAQTSIVTAAVAGARENVCNEAKKTKKSRIWIFKKKKTAAGQHENRRAAMFINEDCVDSRSDVDDLRTHDCLYGERSQVRYEGCYS